MTQLGFNLLGHPNVGKGKVLDFSTLKTQMFRVSEICGIYFAKGHNTNDLWFRIRGGNGSQKFGLEIWTDEMIEAWATDQKYHGFKVIYTVNYNDVNDYEVYQKIASKINIHAIEMGNEQYLPKFTKLASQDKTGVVTKLTEKMTVTKYRGLTRWYLFEYEKENLPKFIQFAPEGKGVTYYKQWNEEVLKFMNENPKLDLNACVHCYGNDYPYPLLSKIKERINGKRLFVTEYGAVDDVKHANKIKERLGENDCMMSHELYNDYKAGEGVSWFNDNGLTIKGTELIKTLF